MNFQKSKELQQKSHGLIPGGCHTYAKGDDQYPELAPSFIARGEGCRVWDVDGNEFIEYGMGLRAVTLGHAYPPVVEAASRQMLLGNNFTRPAVIEVDCAEALLGLIEGADMVKFAKNGSDATTAAVKLARAYTGRDIVAVCADHPFFSVDDWYIGATEMSAGIPQAIRALTVKFRYNDPKSLATLFDQYPGKIACVILEPEKEDPPVDGFLQEVQQLCRRNGVVFILDEMITGFRWHIGGAQKCYGVIPDLSTFGKAMANGFSVSALVGKRELMDLGGVTHDRERVFLLSTTHGAECPSLAAAIATMKVYKEENVVDYLHRQGRRLQEGVSKAITENGLEEHFQVRGRASNLVYVTRDQNKQPCQAFRSLFLQETIRRGLLAPSFVVSFSHDDQVINDTVEIVSDALKIYKKALGEGVDKYLVGCPVKPVFRQFN